MPLAILDPRVLAIIRTVQPQVRGEDYYVLAAALNEAENAALCPRLILRPMAPSEFEVGLDGAALVRIRQRAGSNALAEWHTVLAATGQPVALPGSPEAIRQRLQAATELVAKKAGVGVGNLLGAGLHVGKAGAWWDYDGRVEVVTA